MRYVSQCYEVKERSYSPRVVAGNLCPLVDLCSDCYREAESPLALPVYQGPTMSTDVPFLRPAAAVTVPLEIIILCLAPSPPLRRSSTRHTLLIPTPVPQKPPFSIYPTAQKRTRRTDSNFLKVSDALRPELLSHRMRRKCSSMAPPHCATRTQSTATSCRAFCWALPLSTHPSHCFFLELLIRAIICLLRGGKHSRIRVQFRGSRQRRCRRRLGHPTCSVPEEKPQVALPCDHCVNG
jgi:hypothetical protein